MSRLDRRDIAGLDSGIYLYVSQVPLAVIFGGSVVAAAVGSSFRAGRAGRGLDRVLGSLAVIAVALVEAVRRYRFDTSLILAGDAVPLCAVGENLRTSCGAWSCGRSGGCRSGCSARPSAAPRAGRAGRADGQATHHCPAQAECRRWPSSPLS